MEFLDIVNEKDEIEKSHILYEDVHASKALHRGVHLLLFNSTGELLLQLRSENKKAFPLHWTFSAGGHVRHGETYEQALVREVKEELEIDLNESKFVFKGEGIYEDENGHKIYYKNYYTTYDGPIEVENNEEVAAVQFVEWETLREMIANPQEKLHSEFVSVMRKFWGEKL